MRLRSYRARLGVYFILLVLFLSGTLLYSYRYVHQFILDEADNHLVRLKQLLEGHLNAERNELQRYATIVAQDLRLKEYMYVVTGIGGDSEPLTTLYEREFGWLPIDRRIILSSKNQILVGKDQKELTEAVQQFIGTNGKGIFYYQGSQGMEMVAVAPIQYRDNTLGRVAVSRLLNNEWLANNRRITHGEFFFIKNARILRTTIKSFQQTQFEPKENRLTVDSIPYRIYQIELPGINTQKPSLWFGLSENEILAKLEIHRSFILTQLGAGMIAVLLLGLVIIRNFSGPLNKLIHLTRQVASGQLPALSKLKVTNEFDELSNHFADMLNALRAQQEQIESTQHKLEQSAITDSLTGLYNRRYMQEVFPKLLGRSEREGSSIYAILLDLDNFKKINDTFGHMAGDQCLVAFADIMNQESRTSDYLFRLGGEEFLVLSVHNNILEAASFADKLRIAVENRPVLFNDQLINITVSGGVSPAKLSGSAESVLEYMLSCADIALYKAKKAGRNRIHMSNMPDEYAKARNSNARIEM